ncbi:hypothetical protein SDC9_212560 [bioreactor metagenome]|uniref:Uncharacterized protein n=1 Tax=bioreactor metagenome TaxID=1076179 RepID=A0A645K0W2_9ZZZZ
MPPAGTKEYDGAEILRNPNRGPAGFFAGGECRNGYRQPPRGRRLPRAGAVQTAGTVRSDPAQFAVGETGRIPPETVPALRGQHRSRAAARDLL